MKNLLMGAAVLCIFSISVVLIQTSCSKAGATPLDTQLNKILYTDFNGDVWISDYDGTNANQIHFALPTNVRLELSAPRMAFRLSPDGQKIFFSGANSSTGETGIYSSDISGNNVVVVKVGTGGTQPILCGVY